MIKKLTATVLSDNIGADEMAGEWGLSIYIEADGTTCLLDVGASALFSRNAGKLGKDIGKVDFAVLSHAHHDHSLGMEVFFAENEKAPFYLRKGTEENCYKKVGFFPVYIGIPRGILKKYPRRFCFAEGDLQVAPDIYLIPHHTPGLAQQGKRENMYRGSRLHLQYDDFSHEQSLVFDTEEGLVVFNSCSHGGADNIIREVGECFPGKSVRAIIGGFHLFNKTEAEVRSFGRRVKDTGISYVCTGHCTGDRAYGILQQELEDRLHRLHVGLVMEF